MTGPGRHPVVLARHGQTEWSKSGQHTGRTDVPLTEVGRERAIELRPLLADWDFALVLTSPLSRAKQTMELAGLTGEVDDNLLEWDYGDYEGRTTAEIRETIPDWLVWTHPIVGGESAEEVGLRADKVISRITAADGPVILFAHGHVLRILAARWIEQPARFGQCLHLDTAGLSELGYEHEYRVLARWNSLGPLRETHSP